MDEIMVCMDNVRTTPFGSVIESLSRAGSTHILLVESLESLGINEVVELHCLVRVTPRF